MRKIGLAVLLLSASFLLAQDNSTANNSPQARRIPKDRSLYKAV